MAVPAWLHCRGRGGGGGIVPAFPIPFSTIPQGGVFGSSAPSALLLTILEKLGGHLPPWPLAAPPTPSLFRALKSRDPNEGPPTTPPRPLPPIGWPIRAAAPLPSGAPGGQTRLAFGPFCLPPPPAPAVWAGTAAPEEVACPPSYLELHSSPLYTAQPWQMCGQEGGRRRRKKMRAGWGWAVTPTVSPSPGHCAEGEGQGKAPSTGVLGSTAQHPWPRIPPLLLQQACPCGKKEDPHTHRLPQRGGQQWGGEYPTACQACGHPVPP